MVIVFVLLALLENVVNKNVQKTNLAFNVLALVHAKTERRVIQLQVHANVHQDGGVNIVSVYVLLVLLVKNVCKNAIVLLKEEKRKLMSLIKDATM